MPATDLSRRGAWVPSIAPPAPVRALVLALALAATGCHRCRDPELVPYETPAEAVYRVADELGARGQLAARRMVLVHLVARYPNSRFAVMARQDVAAMDAQGRGSDAEP